MRLGPNFNSEFGMKHQKSYHLVEVGVKSTLAFIYFNQKACLQNWRIIEGKVGGGGVSRIFSINFTGK